MHLDSLNDHNRMTRRGMTNNSKENVQPELAAASIDEESSEWREL